MSTLLAAGRWCAPAPREEGWLAVDEGVIVETGSGRPPGRAERLDRAVLVPGFVDLQVNGVRDVDFAVADTAGYRRAGRHLLAHGVTAYCPTLVTAPLDHYVPALTRVRDARADASSDGLPDVLGVHLEGPFLGRAPGAHPVHLLRRAEPAWLAGLLDRFPGLLAIVTLAPEADRTLAATKLLVERGVLVALGHSTASFDEARAAADAGARLVTHLFNGMGPLHHREPGLVGAALDDERLTATLIADLVHVHPAVLRLAIARKTALGLVTDSVAIDAGVVGDLPVTERDGVARLENGTLAGSTLTMDRAVRNVVRLGVSIERAIEMAATIPAGVLGLTDRGRLEAGNRADVVALDADSLDVRAVWLGGERVFGR